MTIHLVKFVDRVRAHEARGAKDFIMSMKDAQDLHADITRVLTQLTALHEQKTQAQQDEVITVVMDGGAY